MKRYNTEVLISKMAATGQTCSKSDDELSECSPTQVEDAWDLPETTSRGTESSYEEYQSIMSEIEEASHSSSDIRASNEEHSDKVGSLDKKLSKQYPTISLSSHHTVVSDITDADCFSLKNSAGDLQQEIDALKYIVSKSKYFSSKEISKRLARLEEISKNSQRTRETASSHTQEGSQRTRNTEDSERSRDTESSERTRDTESTAKVTNTNRRKARKPRKQRPRKVLSTSVLDSSPRDDFANVKQPSSALSLPATLLEDEDEHPSKTKRKVSRRPRPSSVSSNFAGEVVEEFTYRPRPSKTVAKSDNLPSKKNGNDPKKKKRKNRLIGRESLWGSMVRRASGSSSSRTAMK